MESIANTVTLFAVLVLDLQLDWPHSTWIAMALLSVCAWILIVVDMRHRRKL